MSVHTYPRGAVLADDARAAAGLIILGTPLVAIDTTPVVTALFAAGTLLFALHGWRALRQHAVRICVDGDGVGRLAPAPRRIAWHELTDLRLAYYSTRRDRSDGWLQLTLTGREGRLAVDSRLEGFEALARRSAAAAAENRLRLDPATVANLAALGVPAAAVEAGR